MKFSKQSFVNNHTTRLIALTVITFFFTVFFLVFLNLFKFVSLLVYVPRYYIAPPQRVPGSQV